MTDDKVYKGIKVQEFILKKYKLRPLSMDDALTGLKTGMYMIVPYIRSDAAKLCKITSLKQGWAEDGCALINISLEDGYEVILKSKEPFFDDIDYRVFHVFGKDKVVFFPVMLGWNFVREQPNTFSFILSYDYEHQNTGHNMIMFLDFSGAKDRKNKRRLRSNREWQEYVKKMEANNG